VPAPVRLLLASSNSGKLREYQVLAAGHPVEITLLPEIAKLPPFEESAPTFAENAAGKALHYSRLTEGKILADDSGLVVAALGGAPGVHSARYAGPAASDADRVGKLLEQMQGKRGEERRARFICVLALAERGRALAVVSGSAEGVLTEEPRGSQGFGYDPVFLFEPLGRTFAELSREEKNRYSHRGKAFRKLLAYLEPPGLLAGRLGC
jgi:XTP/dITP diphosphohydrolase